MYGLSTDEFGSSHIIHSFSSVFTVYMSNKGGIMALVCPDQKGEILLLQYIVGMTLADNPVLHLYSNNLTPSDSTQIGNLTEVATLTGYGAVTLLSANWTTTQAGGVTTGVYSEETFTFTTDATAYYRWAA
jgi:hypothetical protein